MAPSSLCSRGTLWSWLLAASLTLAATSAGAQTPGAFDASFATGGKVAIHFSGGTGPNNDYGESVVVQPDGKIVVAGRCFLGASLTAHACLSRLTATGVSDASFTGPPGSSAGTGRFRLTATTLDSNARVLLALQADGKLVVATSNHAEFWVGRLNPDGTYDTSFVGTAGTASGHFIVPMPGGVNLPYALLLQDDGKIVIAGRCGDAVNWMPCLARLLPNGNFDATFDGPGTPGNGRFGLFETLVPHFNSEIYALVRQPDGRIVFAGRCQLSASVSNSDFCVGRLTDTGAFDSSFLVPSGASVGIPGLFFMPIGTGYDGATSVQLQADGRIVVAGICTTPADNDFCILRVNPDGSLDTTFDGPSGTGDGKFLLPIGTNNDNLRSVLVQPDGKIILLGSCASGSAIKFCAARLNDDGRLDSTFDGPGAPGNGKFILDLYTFTPIEDSFGSAALQADGKILLAGSCFIPGDHDFCIARLHGGPYGGRVCSLDIDGDGTVSATRDALILSRVALGFTGTAALSGISFAAHASRTTWPAIREYLVTQCGMTLP